MAVDPKGDRLLCSKCCVAYYNCVKDGNFNKGPPAGRRLPSAMDDSLSQLSATCSPNADLLVVLQVLHDLDAALLKSCSARRLSIAWGLLDYQSVIVGTQCLIACFFCTATLRCGSKRGRRVRRELRTCRPKRKAERKAAERNLPGSGEFIRSYGGGGGGGEEEPPPQIAMALYHSRSRQRRVTLGSQHPSSQENRGA